MLKQEIIDAYAAGKIIHWNSQSGGRCYFQYQGVDYYADIYTRYLITKLGPWCCARQGYIDELKSDTYSDTADYDVQVYDTIDDFALSAYKDSIVSFSRAVELMQLGFEVELINSGEHFYIPKRFRDNNSFKIHTTAGIEVTSMPLFPNENTKEKVRWMLGVWYIMKWAKDYKPFDMSLVPFIAIDSEEKHNAAMKNRL